MRNADELAVLAGVVSAVRAELADTDVEQIPIRLRKAAAATGRKVPVPHQRAMIEHVRTDEVFREAVRERWQASGSDDPIAERYLADPELAEPHIRAEAARIALARVETERDLAKADLKQRTAELSTAKKRLASERKIAKQERKKQAQADRRSREGLERSSNTAKESLAEALAEVKRLSDELADERRRLEESQAAVRRLNDRLGKREPATTQTARSSASGLPTDPVGLAAYLDRLERSLRYYREPERPGPDPQAAASPFRLPGGLSPEAPEAVDAVIAAGPDRIIIDGYNLAAAVVSTGSFSTRTGRDAATARADMIKRSTEASVVVVFDAAQVKGDTRFETSSGVEVVFEPEGTADDAICDMTLGTADRCVVVTNDRELQARVHRADCVVLFTTALVSWSEHLNER